MTRQTQALSSRKFFCREGLLSGWHPNYEYRPGQLEMAEAVEKAIAERRHLIVEAGTGTGKTLAYLVPAILSGRRIVISTGTKNLQEQLFFKDVPFLQKHFPRELRITYMKGRNNYACRQKIYDAEREPVLAGLEEVADFEIIRQWEKTTQTGDRAEIKKLPEAGTAWGKVDARRELCPGRECKQFGRCFITLMLQRAQESDIIIVNHHLFFADLALRQDGEAFLIPEYDAVIFDEAHELEDVAGKYFGREVSSYQFEELARDIAAVTRRKNCGSREINRAMEALEERAAQFFSLFPAAEGRSSVPDRRQLLEENKEHYEDLLTALELAGTHLGLIKNAPEEVTPLAARVEELAGNLSFWMESDNRGIVYWMERRGRGTYLQATPIDVSSVLAGKLFDQIGTVILTSATLAVAGGFDYTERRLGVRQARHLIVSGQFDYPSQALLYVPPHMPDPRSREFTGAAAREITQLLAHSRGRAFVLFTSYQQMQAVYDIVSFETDFPTLLQGTAPRSALLDEFRTTKHCVLFATSSFWQGVDVQGEQLSCVIIDKLPFAVPSDPVVEARIRAIREDGGNPFYEFQVPQAAISLKQGFGRLIRSRTDRGVLVLLDNRILKQRYGKVFQDSLPKYAFTTKLEDVGRFFDV